MRTSARARSSSAPWSADPTRTRLTLRIDSFGAIDQRSSRTSIAPKTTQTARSEGKREKYSWGRGKIFSRVSARCAPLVDAVDSARRAWRDPTNDPRLHDRVGASVVSRRPLPRAINCAGRFVSHAARIRAWRRVTVRHSTPASERSVAIPTDLRGAKDRHRGGGEPVGWQVVRRRVTYCASQGCAHTCPPAFIARAACFVGGFRVAHGA